MQYGCADTCTSDDRSGEGDDHEDHDHGDGDVHCEDLVMNLHVADDHCEWHADEMACEDADGDDHDDDHADEDHECEECVESCSAYVMNSYGFTLEAASEWCLTTRYAVWLADTCANDDHDHGEGDDHEDHDHGDGDVHCEDLVDESSCMADDHCEWHADEMACEDADGDDHDDHDHGDGDDHDDHDHGDDEHCDEITDQTECESSDRVNGIDHCADEHGHGDNECDVDAHANVDGLVFEHDGEELYRQFRVL